MQLAVGGVVTSLILSIVLTISLLVWNKLVKKYIIHSTFTELVCMLGKKAANKDGEKILFVSHT